MCFLICFVALILKLPIVIILTVVYEKLSSNLQKQNFFQATLQYWLCFVITELILYCQISFPNVHILFHPLLSVSFFSERLLLEFFSYVMCNSVVYVVLYYSELNIFNLQFLYKNEYHIKDRWIYGMLSCFISEGKILGRTTIDP